MHRALAVGLLMCALPLVAGAQAGLPAQAGFPERPLWVSNMAPSTGQQVRVSTVLYNGTNTTLAGTLTFFIDDTELSSQKVSLPPQSSSIASADWTAHPGAHTLRARLVSGSATQQTMVVNIQVPEPPPPTALQENVDKATAVATQLASSSVPIIQQVAHAVFAETESLRVAGAEKLEQYLENSRKPGVAGNSTSATTTAVKGSASPAASEGGNGATILHSIAQTAAAAAHFVFRSIYLFYLLFVALLFALLSWAYRRLRHPGR